MTVDVVQIKKKKVGHFHTLSRREAFIRMPMYSSTGFRTELLAMRAISCNVFLR